MCIYTDTYICTDSSVGMSISLSPTQEGSADSFHFFLQLAIGEKESGKDTHSQRIQCFILNEFPLTACEPLKYAVEFE